MSRFALMFTAVVAYLLVLSCEDPYTPPSVFDEPEISVEGYLELGPNALPPYILLTESFPYSASFSAEQIAELFIHDAEVTISDGTDTVELTEFCLSDLDQIFPGLTDAALQALGFEELSGIDLCVYVDVAAITNSSSVELVEGGRYFLNIRTTDGRTVNAQTTIPYRIPLDTLFTVNHPNFPENDSLVELRSKSQDPPNEDNYYRIFTQRNDEMRYPAGILGTSGSVTDDKIFSGQESEFTIQRGQSNTADFDFDTFGYFKRGDNITVRVGCIDYEHFRFWQTLEYDSGSQGPFGTYTRVQSNINGGLGIWGGISYNEYTLVVPE